MYLNNETDFQLLFGGLLISILVMITWIDISEYRIPDWLNISLVITGISWQVLTNLPFLPFQFCFALLLGLLMLLVRKVYFLKSGHHGLGLGDVKMSFAAAFWISPANLPMFIFISSAVGLVYALVRVPLGKTKLVPFGPFLSLGLFATWIWENIR